MAGMNETPSGERVHIGFFGRRNAGKSSLVNAVTGQDLAVVSDVKGTTTDPVTKSMELLPLGPVVIIDTPGYDDEGSLGELRVQRTRKILEKTDIAVLVIDTTDGFKSEDAELADLFAERNVPCIIALNKSDISEDSEDHNIDEESMGILQAIAKKSQGMVHVSTVSGQGIDELKIRLAALKPEEDKEKLIADKINRGDIIVLVVPIDKAAPKGRLILPQQQIGQQLQNHVFGVGIGVYHPLFLSVQLAYDGLPRQGKGFTADYPLIHRDIFFAVDEAAQLLDQLTAADKRGLVFIKALPAFTLRKLTE